MRLTEQPSTGVDLLTQYCASGAPELFAQIMRAYGGMVFSVCLKVTRDPADAEDASQATFLTLAVQCKTGAKITYLGPWLKKVAKRSSLDLVRSRKRRTRRENITAENRPEYYGVHPGTRSADSEINQIIRAELDELPAKYRMPLVLHYFGGLSHDEISREMHCTPAALGVRLHRGRKMLGKRLKARNVTLEGMALGAALATSVHYVLNERLIHTTTTAASALAWSRPGLGAMTALGASLPASFGVVPQLVQQVAISMHHARLKFATLAMALSITMLGGAAEAVRHLPDSIRPNLDFLSPAKALENLFHISMPAPRVQEIKPAKTNVATVDTENDREPTVTYAPPIEVPQTIAQQPIVVKPHPILALEIQRQTPPSNGIPEELKAKSPQNVIALTQIPKQLPAAGESEASSKPAHNLHVGSASASSGSGEKEAVHLSAVSGVSQDPNVQSLSKYIPSPAAFEASSNLNKVSAIGSSKGGLVDGTKLAAGVNPALPALAEGSLLAASMADGTHMIVDGCVELRSNDVFVNAGEVEYAWSDPSRGITQDGINSIRFTLHDASRGVVTIERLSRKSTLAPDRPAGHTFIGLWSFNTAIDYSSIDLTVKYDNTLAQTLGLREDVLKLWGYNGTTWLRINDGSFSRDLDAHSLSGSTRIIEFIGVSAPEPSMIGILGVLAGGLLRRRRKAE